MTPEKSETKGRKMKSASISQGSPNTGNASGGSIKLSSGSLDSAKTKVPHYLRASTGSCHDLCKHGNRSTTVSLDSAKTKPTLHLRASTGSCHDSCEHGSNLIQSLDSAKSKAPIYLRSSGSCHDFCKFGIKNLSKEEVRKDKRFSKRLPKKTMVGKSYDTKSDVETCPENQEAIIRREAPLPLSSLLSSPVLVKPVKVKLLAALEGRKNSNAIATGKKTLSTISSKRHSVSPSKVTKPAALKGQNNVTQVETGTSNSKMPEKILHVSNSSSHEGDGEVKCNGNDAAANEFVPEKGIQATKRSGNKIDKFVLEKTIDVEINIRHKVDDKEVIHKDRNAQELVSNKIEAAKVAKAIPPPQSQPSSVPKTLAHTKMTPSLKLNPTKITTTRRVTPSKDKPVPSVKLKFRQGTVLNPQPSDNHNVPRRLKFRRPSLSGTKPDDKKKSIEPVNKINKTSRTSVTSEEKSHTRAKLPWNPASNLWSGTNSSFKNVVKNRGDELSTRRLSFKTVGDNKGETSTRRLPLSYKSIGDTKSESLTRRSKPFKRSGSKDGAAAGGEITSLKIHLKHRSVQKKKATRVLFNNVIEETANKLVESRKSKVKALVGAFETVIQELRHPTKVK